MVDARKYRTDKKIVSEEEKPFWRHAQLLQKEISMETKERQSVEFSLESCLLNALTEYIKILQMSNDAEVEITFQIINLWFTNAENADVNQLIDDMVTTVASYKFVSLSYQIFSRLGSDISDNNTDNNTSHNGDNVNNNTFQNVLKRLILKMCSDHPYHTLPQLFALCHEGEVGNDFKGAAEFKSNMSQSRCQAAKTLVTMLESSVVLKDIVISTRQLLLAYIQLANMSTEAFQK